MKISSTVSPQTVGNIALSCFSLSLEAKESAVAAELASKSPTSDLFVIETPSEGGLLTPRAGKLDSSILGTYPSQTRE
eukprot:m.267671 g.267671  ORF g.267671 m.267671 type:complete len:78 (+) comp16047_c0_seq13:1961-2194(+)